MGAELSQICCEERFQHFIQLSHRIGSLALTDGDARKQASTTKAILLVVILVLSVVSAGCRSALGCNHVRKLTLMLFGLVTKVMILCSIWPVIGNFSTTCVMVLVDSIVSGGITKHCILFRFSQ
jgi:hypothetical protein